MVQRGGNSSVVDGRELIKDKEGIGKHEDKVKVVIEGFLVLIKVTHVVSSYIFACDVIRCDTRRVNFLCLYMWNQYKLKNA